MALLALLVGCSPSDEGEPSSAGEATGVPTVAAPTTSPLPTPEQMDTKGACAAFWEGDEPLADRVVDELAALGAQADQQQLKSMADIATELDALAQTSPPEIAAILRRVAVPFNQAADALGGSDSASVTFDTGSGRDGSVDMIFTCSEADYQMK